MLFGGLIVSLKSIVLEAESKAGNGCCSLSIRLACRRYDQGRYGSEEDNKCMPEPCDALRSRFFGPWDLR